MRGRLLIFLFFINAYVGYSQELRSIKMKDPVVCYGHTTDHNFTIPPPAEYLLWKQGGARVKNATIEIIFNDGFTPEAQAAFRTAADIWESLITSSETITIDAYWLPLGSGVLGGAIYTSAFANFDGAQKLNTFYPVVLAEKISGQNLNGTDPEIFTQFSSTTNWHYNPATTPPAGSFDLITVVLHEIGHGLGLSGSFSITAGQGEVGVQGTGVPIAYDVPVENGSSANLIETIVSPSSNMATQLTSQNLFFNSHTSGRPKLYAPASFSDGSSISHLDENIFNGTGNSLMTPFVAPMERMHDPGIALNMLKDMGWENVRINHQPLPNTENVSGPYTVTVTIQADNGYQAGTVKLNYTINGTTTQVPMTPTANPHEFTALIPTTNSPETYSYFISLLDDVNREFVNPGKIVRKLNTQLQRSFVFETGPDTQAPKIEHTPTLFLIDQDTETTIEAVISDNIGIASAKVEYLLNEVAQTPVNLILQSPPEDSVYAATINISSLTNNQTLKYRIVAVDNSSNSNQAVSPASGYFTVLVVGLEPTQDFYANDFSAPENDDDFFGNGFTIIQPAGFSDRALHSEHPYINGDGFPENERSLIYQLRVPVRVKTEDATLKFDEIALIEPGDPGSVFGSANFYDYVIVEGSKNGGVTWDTLLPGYDARDYAPWLERYNSLIDGNNNSTATGDPSLYKSRTIDLLTTYEANDEVVIRFRVYIDQLASGWGWAIDNVKIQIDETPPLILHNHVDYLFDEDDELPLTTKVSDASGIKEYKFEYFINSGAVETYVFDVDPPQTEYPFNLTDLAPLSIGDVINYRFVATDSADIEGYFPSTGFIQVPIIEFATPVSTYANNFNTASTDFVGNFFSISQPLGFANGAIHSKHNYPLGLGLSLTSDLNYILTKPITIADDNTLIRFDEIALVEGQSSGVAFGTPAFNDYIIVEGSKDGGETWSRFLDGYDAVSQSVWLSAFNNQSTGTPGLFRTRAIDMTGNGNFESGDDVIIRFRLFSNQTINGWGWAIDNLYIQDAITGTEKELEAAVSVYPNPTKGNFMVEAVGLTSPYFNIQLNNVQGQSIYKGQGEAVNGKMSHIIYADHLPAGLYIVKISNQGKTVIKKVMKTE